MAAALPLMPRSLQHRRQSLPGKVWQQLQHIDTKLKHDLTVVTLVTGANSTAREAAIVSTMTNALPAPANTALILEGIPDGGMALDAILEAPGVTIVRIAQGCVCCTGKLVMTVTLNRVLHRHPQRLFISLASSAHLGQVRQFLTQAPYDTLLALTDDLHCRA